MLGNVVLHSAPFMILVRIVGHTVIKWEEVDIRASTIDTQVTTTSIWHLVVADKVGGYRLKTDSDAKGLFRKLDDYFCSYCACKLTFSQTNHRETEVNVAGEPSGLVKLMVKSCMSVRWVLNRMGGVN